MTSTLSIITQHLTQDFQSFFNDVSSLTSVQLEDLIKIWETSQSKAHISSASATKAVRVNRTNRTTTESTSDTVSSTSATTTSVKRGRKPVNGALCDYVFQKGKNPGKTCGASVCADSTTKCRKHLETKSASQVKSSSLTASLATVSAPIQNTVRSAKLSISRNEYGNYEHKATNLVFNDEKLVYGKQVLDKILPLSMADIENCKRYNFKWVTESVVKPEPDEPDDDEEEIEKLVESYMEEELLEEVEDVEEEDVEEEDVEDVEEEEE